MKALEQSAQEMHLEIIRSQVSHMTINTVHVLLFLSHDNQYMPFTSLLSLLSLSLQIGKALELNEQLRQRMGVVIVGPSGSGKSTIWKLLKSALSKLNQPVKDYTMNPKALPRTQV